MRVPPSFWIEGSETPYWSTRFPTISMARSMAFLVSSSRIRSDLVVVVAEAAVVPAHADLPLFELRGAG